MSDDNKFIRELYKKYVISSMLSLFGNMLGQIVSAIIIGNSMGSDSLSVIGITLPIYYVFATLGAMIGVGGAAVCARLTGEGRFGDSRRAFKTIFALAIFAALMSTVILLSFFEQVVGLLGVSRDMAIYTDVKNFAKILCLGGICNVSIYPAFNLLRFNGQVKTAVVVTCIQGIVTILLDIIFLFIFKMGVSGVAIATIAGSGVAGAIGIVFLYTKSKNSSESDLSLYAGEKRISRQIFDILKLGSPSGTENLCIIMRVLVLNRIIVNVINSIDGLSALKVIDSIYSLAIIFILGVSGPLLPFIGVFNAEKDTKSIRQILKLSFRWGVSIITIFTIVCLVFTGQISQMFGMGSIQEQAIVLPAIKIFALSLIPAMINNILISLYQGSGKTMISNIMTVSRTLAGVLLSVWFLSDMIGILSVWHGFWIAELLALLYAVVMSIFYRKNNKYATGLFLLDAESELMGKYKSFSVRNNTVAITESAESIANFCESNGLSPKRVMAISLATEEMLISIHQHCLLDNDDLTISVRLLIMRDAAILRIRNGGGIFNPINYYERMRDESQTTNGLEKVELLSDSLGIKMILDLADTVDYRSTFGVNNLTIII